MCLRELRNKVSDGVDPTKLQEPQVQPDSVDEQGIHFLVAQLYNAFLG